MVKVFEPFRRDGSRTVDPGADFARQLDRFGRDVKRRITALEVPAGNPPFGKVLKSVNVPGDNLVHTAAHGLGRAYVGALVIGYHGSGWHVLMLAPDYFASTFSGDPTVNVGFVNQYTTPGGGAPTVDPAIFDLWVW